MFDRSIIRCHRIPVIVLLAFLSLSGMSLQTLACPFCNAVSQTLRQEMSVMDAVIIATATQSDMTRDKESGEVMMKVEKVLKGSDHVSEGQTVKAIYYGEVGAGRRFMLSGVDPPNLQWSCLPLTERGEAYVVKIMSLPDDALERLRFYHAHLQDEELMLSRDAYDEFAVAPYDVIQKLGPEMDHDQLVQWIGNAELTTDRKRLYLTMLGVCGDEKDLPFLETLLRSTQKSTRGGLDALVACYLTLAGEKGIPLINELFLANKQAPYADTYAAIMAVRFHGTEGGVIPRSALVESLHHVLDRQDLADLIIPDLARWSDWSQVDRLKRLFLAAEADNNWVRVPVVNYLRACPLPEAKAAIEELEKVDPESVRRANTFFTVPVPARDTGSSSSSIQRLPGQRPNETAQVPMIGQKTANANGVGLQAAVSPPMFKTAGAVSAPIVGTKTGMNLWRLAYVVVLALATVMIAQFLLLSGGSRPSVE